MIALGGCYAVWVLALFYAGSVPWVWWIPAALAAALHSSLQHEVLHGHPTRSPLLNEALVFPALSVFYPYRRYREMHLKHHNNPLLTDPYDDPESWYVAQRDWAAMSPIMRAVLNANGTLAGRLIVGPWLGLYAFARSDFGRWRRGETHIPGQWMLHLPALGVVFGFTWACGTDPLTYLLAVVWPSQAILAIRTYIEHRAAPAPEHRSAIVEAEWLFRLLFLNNSLHALHHERPTVPWSKLPELYRAEADAVVQRNGGYLVRGYLSVFARYLFRRREPVEHPYRRRIDT